MTQEEKELLLKDLCARLPYRVKINCFDVPRTLESISIDCDEFITIDCGGEHFYHPLSNILHKDCLPYLRSLSSMTEEEKKEFSYTILQQPDLDAVRNWQTISIDLKELSKVLDWLNKKMFDYRGLIEKGLGIDCTGLNIYENEKSI